MDENPSALRCPSCGYDYSGPDGAISVNDVFAYATIDSGSVRIVCSCGKPLEFTRTVKDTITAVDSDSNIPIEVDEIPYEILDLVRFMCSTWSDIDRFVYKHCDGEALSHYPVVQGTPNQIRLQRIGEQAFDPYSIKKAVEFMQRFNK